MNCTISCWMMALPLGMALGCSGSGNAVSASASVGGAPATGGSSNIIVGGTTASSNSSQGGVQSTGGAHLVGGTDSTGAVVSVGGTVATGGSKASTGGTVSTGGAHLTGGTMSVASTVNTGGAITTGGAVGIGGSKAATGGAATTGGFKATTGGIAATGGAVTTGGSKATTGGTAATGGAVTTGGMSTTAGGANPAGGSPDTCSRTVGSCTSPTVNVTNVSLGIAVTGYGSQADTDPLPMAISAMPSGGSRLAWLGTDKKVYVAQLDCSDQLVGTPFSLPAEDLQDIYADDNGGVLMLVRNATNSGTDNCGSGTLCGGTSSQCQTTWLVRFDNSGSVIWETQVTNLTSSLAGYDNRAIFTWKNYQHHGRIAFDGSNYAAYFGAAITVYHSGSSGCIDIHEGDRMQVVDSSGKLLTGHESFDWGCSHSWTTRILYDSTNKAFVLTCATDADNCAIERPGTGKVLFQATCSGQFFNGDLIPAADSGYWSAWSDKNSISLNHFTFDNIKGASVSNAGSSQHPHLVALGASNMLLSWGSGSSQSAQVRDRTTGATVGSQFTVAVSDHVYLAYKPYSDGSAAYAAAGSNNTSIKVARVMPCQ